MPVEIGGAVLTELIQLAESRVAAYEGDVAILRRGEEHAYGGDALAVEAQSKRLALARGGAEVDAAELRGNRAKGRVVGPGEDRDQARFVEGGWGAVATCRRRSALAAGPELAQLVQEGRRDALCRGAGLTLRLGQDITAVAEAPLESVWPVKDLDQV